MVLVVRLELSFTCSKLLILVVYHAYEKCWVYMLTTALAVSAKYPMPCQAPDLGFGLGNIGALYDNVQVIHVTPRSWETDRLICRGRMLSSLLLERHHVAATHIGYRRYFPRKQSSTNSRTGCQCPLSPTLMIDRRRISSKLAIGRFSHQTT